MKDSYYFPHDTNSIQDPKMVNLLMECGAAGVGLFWIIIEIMHQQCGRIARAELSHYIDLYGNQGTYDQLTIDKVKEVLFTTKLLVEKDGFVYSERVQNNLKKRAELSEKARESASKRWGADAVALRSQCQPNAIKGKERKEKRRIEEASKDFDLFWKEYPKKVGKEPAFKSWRKINPVNGLVERIVSAVISQRSSAQWTKDGGEYIPHPATWLNQKRWEDEVIIPKKEVMPEWKQKQLDHIRRQATESELKTN